MTIKERIAARLKATGKKQKELAAYVGVEPPAVSQWLNPRKAGPTPDKIPAIADFLQCSKQWLMFGEGEPEASTKALLPQADDAFTLQPIPLPSEALLPDNLPVLGSARCGPDGAFEMNGQAHEYIPRPPELARVPHAYAVYIRGDSMSPRYEPGWIVRVHPHKSVAPGDNVVVQIKNPDPHDPPLAYVKVLASWESGGKLVVRQFNPPKELFWDDAEVVSVHKIVSVVYG